MKIILDGRLIDARQAHVSVFDHSFLYGDGIYETVRAYDYSVFHWPEHFRRLKQSARRIQLKCPWSSRWLHDNIVRVLRANHASPGSVRISISRGAGPLGLDPSLCPKPTLVMLLLPERPVEVLRREGVSIGIPEVRRNHPRCLDPQIKSNNSLNTILAKMEGKAMRVFETVLLNLEGFLTEGTICNVFFVRKGEIFTPALSCGLLEGITREAVIRLSRKAGRKVHEGRYTPADLLRAAEVFLSSTTLEIMPVTRLTFRGKARPIGKGKPGPLSCELQRSYRTYVQKELSL
jgi:branched-chain amino acid aminotransferase